MTETLPSIATRPLTFRHLPNRYKALTLDIRVTELSYQLLISGITIGSVGLETKEKQAKSSEIHLRPTRKSKGGIK